MILLLVDADKKTAVGGHDDDDDRAMTTKTTTSVLELSCGLRMGMILHLFWCDVVPTRGSSRSIWFVLI